jgi:hypothetical protein
MDRTAGSQENSRGFSIAAVHCADAFTSRTASFSAKLKSMKNSGS